MEPTRQQVLFSRLEQKGNERVRRDLVDGPVMMLWRTNACVTIWAFRTPLLSNPSHICRPLCCFVLRNTHDVFFGVVVAVQNNDARGIS
jgi:hypothetical protein